MQKGERHTGVVQLAWRVLCAPERLPQVLGVFLGGAEVCWQPSGLDVDAGPHGGGPLLRLPDPAGGTLTARRAQGRFTWRELAGVKTYAWLARRPTWTWGRGRRVTFPGGWTVTVRPAGPADLRAVTSLHALCVPSVGRGPDGLPTGEELHRL